MTRVTSPAASRRDTDAPVAVDWTMTALVAGSVTAALLLLGPWYGYHRDEMYFRMLSEHLAWGYVDQPPLTPLLARGAIALFGDTVWALRVPAALCAGLVTVLVVLLTRELGGGRRAQLAAAVGTAWSAFALIAGHTLLTATLDLPLWLAAMLFAVRALRRDGRWWLAVGATAGLALYNRHLVVLLGIGLVTGLLLAGPRRVFTEPWLWLGGGLALLLGAPNIWYQATNGWPQFEMAGALAADNGFENRVLFVPMQLVLLGVFLVPLWVAGWYGLVRNPRWRDLRAFAVAYPVAGLLVVASGGRPDYTFGLLVLLYAAGCAHTEEWFAAGRGKRILLTAGLVLNSAVAAVLMLPLVPVDRLGDTPIPAINQVARDSVGWPAYVAQVSDVYHSLPASDRENAAIITANYGEAGALHRYRADHGLPAVYSGQNELYYRAVPPETATVVIVVGYPRRALEPDFARCEERARLDNGVGVDNEEQGVPIVVCHDPVDSWRRLWPRFQHYD